MENRKETRILRVDPAHPESAVIEAAAEVIKRGGTVAFPTETVYGLGADALDAKAVSEIFDAKGRPRGNPLIVHIASLAQGRGLVAHWPPAAELLARKFWPGPLTLILPRASIVPDEVTAGLPNVALRFPAHPVALALIEAGGTPIAAPSANLSGHPSPTCSAHVLADLAGKVDLILDGGPTEVGLESTILDLSRPRPVLLRPGGVSREALEAVLEKEIQLYPAVLQGVSGKNKEETGVAPSPGTRFKHYAPAARVVMVTGTPEQQADKIINYLAEHPGVRVGVLTTVENSSFYQAKGAAPAHLETLGSRRSPEEIANRLFSALRKCDEMGVDVILVETIPVAGIGLAVMNRLSRAAENHAL